MIEITKACTVTFMKAKKYLIIGCREKRVNLKKKKMVKRYFLKLLKIDFD